MSICRRKTCNDWRKRRNHCRGTATPGFRALLAHEVDFARVLFEEGLPLIGMVDRDLSLDLDLFSRGGLEILRAIERQDYDVLRARPAISKRTKLALAFRAVCGKALAISSPERTIHREGGLTHAFTLRRSLRDLQGNRQTRSEELLLRLPGPARGTKECNLRDLRIHAPGRRPRRR